MRTTLMLASAFTLSMSTLFAAEARADDAAPVLAHAGAQSSATPPSAPEPERAPRTHLHSPGLIGGGTALAVVGTLMMVGGGAVYASSQPTGGFMDMSGIGRVVGMALLVDGAAHVVPGAIMIGLGADRDPDRPRVTLSPSASVMPTAAAFGVSGTF